MLKALRIYRDYQKSIVERITETHKDIEEFTEEDFSELSNLNGRLSAYLDCLVLLDNCIQNNKDQKICIQR